MHNFEAAGQTVRRIWTVVGTVIALMAFFSVGEGFNGSTMAAAVVLAISALVATISIFYLTKLTIEAVGPDQQAAKQKNDDRQLRELLARLDDSRRERLRDLLDQPTTYALDDDGELIQRRRK
jgi:hypothetical protein